MRHMHQTSHQTRPVAFSSSKEEASVSPVPLPMLVLFFLASLYYLSSYRLHYRELGAMSDTSPVARP